MLVFVDGSGDDGGAEFFGEFADEGDAFFAVFEVHGIEDAATAGEFETGFHDVGVGAVEHEGDGEGVDESFDDFVHIAGAVAADEIDAEVEDMGAVADFVAGHGDEGVEVIFLEEAFELSGAVGIGSFGDDEVAGILADVGGGDEAGDLGFRGDGAGFGFSCAEGGGEGLDVGGGGAAAAADDIDAEVFDETDHSAGEVGGGEWELGVAIDHEGHAGVGEDADESGPVLGEVLDVFGEFGGSCGAVEAEAGDLVIGEDGSDEGGGIGAEEHGLTGVVVHGALDDDGEVEAVVGESAGGGDDGTFDLEEVLGGFDEEGIDAAGDEATELLVVALFHDIPGGLAEGEEFGAGSSGAEDVARVVGGFEFEAGLAGDFGSAFVEVEGLVCEAELGEDDVVCAEGVGFDGIGADGEEGLVYLADEVGSGVGEDFGAVFVSEPIAVEVKWVGMDAGTHGSVEEEDALADEIEECGAHVWETFLDEAAGNQRPEGKANK